MRPEQKFKLVKSALGSADHPSERAYTSGDDGDPPMTDYVTHGEFQEFRHEVGSRFARVETRLDHMATKADLAEMKADMVKWIVGTAIALGATAITVMTFVLNNAAPKQPVAPTQPPIIINVPAPAPPAIPAPPAQ